MTVQEICDKLLEYFKEHYEADVQDKVAYVKDIFPDSLENSFTESIIRELQGKVAQGSTTEEDAISIQESLSFIGALQREESYRKVSRLSRILRGYRFRRDLSDSEGPVGLQLKHIGAKSSDEFLEKLQAGS